MSREFEALVALLSRRTSVREYTDDPVDEKTIRDIVRLASLAPSGQNRQPWDFYAVTGPEKIAAIAAAIKAKVESLAAFVEPDSAPLFEKYRSFFAFFEKAPCVIAVAAKPYENIKGIFRPEIDAVEFFGTDTTHIQSCSAAVMALLLAAEAAGLGACWNTNALVAKKEISEILNIRRPFELMCLVSAGHPKRETPARPEKKRYGVDKILKFVTD